MASAPFYGSFAVVTLLVLASLIVLARASQTMLEGGDAEDAGEEAGPDDESPDDETPDASDARDGPPDPDPERDDSQRGNSTLPATGAARIERHARNRNEWNDPPGVEIEENHSEESADGPWSQDVESPWGDDPAERDARRAADAEARRARERPRVREREDISTGALLANVALSQGLFGAVILAAAWLARIPPSALGVTVGDPTSTGLPALAVGVGLGVALYVANELSSVVADSAGIEYSEGLREALAPDTARGWALLFGAVLPIIAGFEELLFRAALVGAFAAGFGVSPWLLAVFSTVAFAVGHGAQGPGGVAVTGLLGFALAAAFVLTESLLVVVVAHYLVNALEFGVHEGLGVEWTDRG
ncbi:MULTISPECIES: CPBP family intramembrane glutamic endopeptidase [Halorussus]|uniref:CPBP family intramembrane glutamic endopeptidase n=1 Tax=Halorussus TaxID=1070314 RepID=UPI0020A048B4|nr:CPBP family intramembrane glutamic endopeptidase [Halorussus vallis]USZ75204.1 CPBP family intramembrane metalloprotease [Halorussus vallis]